MGQNITRISDPGNDFKKNRLVTDHHVCCSSLTKRQLSLASYKGGRPLGPNLFEIFFFCVTISEMYISLKVPHPFNLQDVCYGHCYRWNWCNMLNEQFLFFVRVRLEGCSNGTEFLSFFFFSILDLDCFSEQDNAIALLYKWERFGSES